MKYLPIILLLLLLSCKKERTFHITARNAVTGAPYPGLIYEVMRSWSGPFENKYKSVGSGTLDENGETYFTKRLDKNSSYSISVAPPENTCYTNSSTLSPQGQKNFDADFEFTECAYLTISVNNINCQGPSDKIIFDMQPKYIENYDLISSTEKTGCYSNTFIESEVAFGPWKAT